MLVSLSEAVWSIGVKFRETGEIFLKISIVRYRYIMTRIIMKNVHPGTKIITDFRMGYGGCSELKYEHFTVNYRYNFV